MAPPPPKLATTSSIAFAAIVLAVGQYSALLGGVVKSAVERARAAVGAEYQVSPLSMWYVAAAAVARTHLGGLVWDWFTFWRGKWLISLVQGHLWCCGVSARGAMERERHLWSGRLVLAVLFLLLTLIRSK